MFVLHNNPWGLHFRALVLLVVCATLATREHGLHGFFQTHCTSLTPSRLSDWNKRTPGLPQIMLMHLALLYDHFFHSPSSSRPSLIHRRGAKLSKESYLARLRVSCSNSLIQEACSRNWWCILTTHHYGNIQSVITHRITVVPSYNPPPLVYCVCRSFFVMLARCSLCILTLFYTRKRLTRYSIPRVWTTYST